MYIGKVILDSECVLYEKERNPSSFVFITFMPKINNKNKHNSSTS